MHCFVSDVKLFCEKYFSQLTRRIKVPPSRLLLFPHLLLRSPHNDVVQRENIDTVVALLYYRVIYYLRISQWEIPTKEAFPSIKLRKQKETKER